MEVDFIYYIVYIINLIVILLNNSIDLNARKFFNLLKVYIRALSKIVPRFGKINPIQVFLFLFFEKSDRNMVNLTCLSRLWLSARKPANYYRGFHVPTRTTSLRVALRRMHPCVTLIYRMTATHCHIYLPSRRLRLCYFTSLRYLRASFEPFSSADHPNVSQLFPAVWPFVQLLIVLFLFYTEIP